jgi:hypothetical protein
MSARILCISVPMNGSDYLSQISETLVYEGDFHVTERYIKFLNILGYNKVKTL